ncbi:uncharacterized protein DS421_8g241380 [Arachis hypogaea]|nr:uncharacterized protein DS421_8g241380 [Arachis hypogaea]
MRMIFTTPFSQTQVRLHEECEKLFDKLTGKKSLLRNLDDVGKEMQVHDQSGAVSCSGDGADGAIRKNLCWRNWVLLLLCPEGEEKDGERLAAAGACCYA